VTGSADRALSPPSRPGTSDDKLHLVPINPELQKARAVELHGQETHKFESWYRQYDVDVYTSTFTYGRKKIEELIQPIIGSLPPGSRALDVGCGTGFNLVKLRESGFEVVGIEPSAEMRSLAQSKADDIPITDGDIERLPLESSSFDLVLAIEVIRYLPDATKALAEVARVLRPGGVAIVTAAPRWSLNGYAVINTVTSRVKLPSFAMARQSFMSQRQAFRLLEAAGFSDCEVHGLFLGPWHPLGRLSSSALGAALRAWEPVDNRLADRQLLRDLTNHLVLIGRK
jgi:ubiquinone/menaquinone biosynthesis C-methylase UbiE